MQTFTGWLRQNQLLERLEPLDIVPAFELMCLRVSAARSAGARDPMKAAVSTEAGPQSRRATRRMLEQLGYDVDQRRIVHRLLGGSPSGFPGLMKLYIQGAELLPAHRRYVLRQVREYHRSPSGIREQARRRHGEGPSPLAVGDRASRP